MVRKSYPEKKLSDVAYDLRKGVSRNNYSPSLSTGLVFCVPRKSGFRIRIF